MKQRLKELLFRLLGKEPEAVVVSFVSGDEALARRMIEEVRALEPGRRHYAVALGPFNLPGVDCITVRGDAGEIYLKLRRAFRGLRIGLVPVLFDGRPHPLHRAAFALAPSKILAYNRRLERHHLRLGTWLASLLFLRGVPLDRIWLRPKWLWPWKQDRSVVPEAYRVIHGRSTGRRRRIGILSPYFPYPLSHGGAVRIFHLIREAAREFDVFLFAFDEKTAEAELAPVLELCAEVVLVPLPRYREPRWSSLRPPEVAEYQVPVLEDALSKLLSEWRIELLQVEYTHLASYGGDVLVEHDVTFDLREQVRRRDGSFAAWWDWWRWHRFETQAVRRYRRVAVMSDKDRLLLGVPQARVIPNGVDLDRFSPQPEPVGRRLLFIGSFRHFPNIAAFRFFTEGVWPLLRDRYPDMAVTVVAGPDPWLYWRQYTGLIQPQPDPRIRVLEFVRDVKPLYDESNIVIVPTPVSAGTNLKVLEAMAMERAVVSTPEGCAGLGLVHAQSIWVAAGAEDFAEGISTLADDPDLRGRLAREARLHAERSFDWKAIGRMQSEMWRELLPESAVRMRTAGAGDVEAMRRIQSGSHMAAQWDPPGYLAYSTWLAEVAGQAAGFIAVRSIDQDEHEILNVAVAPEFRRQGIATEMLRYVLKRLRGPVFLEVRESNEAGRSLYRKLGFAEVGKRPEYYSEPAETAIVMKIHSW